MAQPPLVLTPALGEDVTLGAGAILTVGSIEHVRAAAGRREPVTVKLASSMRRYGVDPSGLPGLLRAVDRAGLDVAGFGLHLPLSGGPEVAEAWLARLPGNAPLAVSHIEPGPLAELRRREHYEKPSERRKRKVEAARRKARRRLMKMARKLETY